MACPESPRPVSAMVKFAIFAFLPMACVFLSPLLFYRQPMSIKVAENIYQFSMREIWSATSIWIGWILIAIAVMTVRLRRSRLVRFEISRTGLWVLFTCFSIAGGGISVVHQLYVLPRGVENIFHILSLSPAMAVVIGVKLLQEKKNGISLKVLIILFLLFDIVSAILVSLLLGYVNGAAVSAIGILYGLFAVRVDRRILVAMFSLFIIVLGIALAYKSYFRDMIYGGNFVRRSAGGVHVTPNNHVTSKDCAGIPDEGIEGIEGARKILKRTGMAEARAIEEMYRFEVGMQEVDKARHIPHDALLLRTMGVMLEHGYKIEKDVHFASKWYSWASSKGDIIAIRRLGHLYRDAQGVPEDLGRAMTCYAVAANGRDREAMRAMGDIYRVGLSGAVNYLEAANWYRRAADLNDSLSMRCIGEMYQKGQGVPRDYAEAASWYRRGAGAGDAVSMKYLSELHKTGMGVEKSDSEAEKWRTLAIRTDSTVYNKLSGIEREMELFREYDPNYFQLRVLQKEMSSDHIYFSVARVAHRLNSLGNLALAVRLIPQRESYTYIETYRPMFYAWVPRILWKDKPVENAGIVLGLKLGYAKPGDKVFVWSMPTIIEAWVAYGVTGIILTAMMIGLLLRLLWQYLIGSGETPMNVVIGVAVIMAIAHLAMSSLNLVFAGTLQVVTVYIVIAFIARRIWPA